MLCQRVGVRVVYIRATGVPWHTCRADLPLVGPVGQPAVCIRRGAGGPTVKRRGRDGAGGRVGQQALVARCTCCCNRTRHWEPFRTGRHTARLVRHSACDYHSTYNPQPLPECTFCRQPCWAYSAAALACWGREGKACRSCRKCAAGPRRDVHHRLGALGRSGSVPSWVAGVGEDPLMVALTSMYEARLLGSTCYPLCTQGSTCMSAGGMSPTCLAEAD